MLNKKIKILGTMIIAGLLCLGMSSCSSSPDSQESLERGASLIEQGRHEEGIEYLRQYVFYHPESFKAHFLLGQSILSEQDTTKELYLARYYFNKARQLAKTEDEQKAADSSYADIQMLMGKGIRSAKVLFESAERYAERGQNTVAANFYLRAGSQYMMEEEYDDAREAFSLGLEIAGNEDCVTALVLGQATAFLLDEEPEKSLATLQELPQNRSSTDLCPTLDAHFLRISAEILSIEAKRKLLTMWKKEISEGESHSLEEKFIELNQVNNHDSDKLSHERSILQAQGWVLVAERFMNLEMTDQAKQAFKQAKTLYELAGSKDKASDISKELEKLES